MITRVLFDAEVDRWTIAQCRVFLRDVSGMEWSWRWLVRGQCRFVGCEPMRRYPKEEQPPAQPGETLLYEVFHVGYWHGRTYLGATSKDLLEAFRQTCGKFWYFCLNRADRLAACERWIPASGGRAPIIATPAGKAAP